MAVEFNLYHPVRHEIYELGKGVFRASEMPRTLVGEDWAVWVAAALMGRGMDWRDAIEEGVTIAREIVVWLGGCADVVLTDDHSCNYPWPDGMPYPVTTSSRYRMGAKR